MDIHPVPSQPAAYVRADQDRFAKAAERVVESVASESDAPEGGDLAGAMVDMASESIVNQVLFSVFRAQSDQQREVASLLDHREK